MHTEDEAKTKECRPGGRNRVDKFDKCSASGCMAWRWSLARETEAFYEAIKVEMRAQIKPDHKKAVAEVYKNKELFEHTEGYCGLSGKPE